MFVFEEQLLNSSNNQGILSQNSLFWWEKDRQKTISLNDVVCVSACNDTRNLISFVVSSYPLVQNRFSKPRRKLQEYHFICPSIAVRSRWLQALNNQLYPQHLQTSRRHLQILLNPYSGRKNAAQIFVQIEPLFAKSNLSYTLSETKEIGDAKLQAKMLDISQIDGLVVVGGDGTIHEVVNGLMSRDDWETAIKTPIGIIPAGTGNGLCKSLLAIAGEPYDLISAAFLIAKGQKYPIDVGMVEQNNQRYYSLLSVSWALPSDVDIESEKLRYFGSLRNLIYGLWRICFLRSYQGQFSFLPATDSQPQTWQIITGNFVLFWAMNSPWTTYDLNVAPLASLNDGKIDVLIIREGISRLQLLLAFFLLYSANGSHLRLPEIEYYQVTQFSLEMFEIQGNLAIDGEVFSISSLKFSLFKKLVSFFFFSGF
ncbi:MAG: diacylglycerol kinase family protein [Oscillatoria sp. PMC 1051.18]|nr:diacylglycerol kinase family protein [Oscillatoria sp. PMC 1050.18]MEC5031964.1 diacylglycerol kinase family protein [Oscillatoria sp. PMC 1051.18]